MTLLPVSKEKMGFTEQRIKGCIIFRSGGREIARAVRVNPHEYELRHSDGRLIERCVGPLSKAGDRLMWLIRRGYVSNEAIAEGLAAQ